MVLMISICALAMLSLAAANLHLLRIATAVLEAEAAPMRQR